MGFLTIGLSPIQLLPTSQLHLLLVYVPAPHITHIIYATVPHLWVFAPIVFSARNLSQSSFFYTLHLVHSCLFFKIHPQSFLAVLLHTHTNTVEYYAVIRKKEIPPLATTWMNLDNIMLSGISQTQKDKYHTILLISLKKLLKI